MKQGNLIQCTNIGMQRDKDIAVISGELLEFAFENKNIRLTANLDSTLLSVTNEKGTQAYVDDGGLPITFQGRLLGSCKFNEFLVLFIKGSTDLIVRLDFTQDGWDPFFLSVLFEGDLNFNLDYPIETLAYYETEDIQKVYWVDGLNPNRCINIVDTNISQTDNNLFNFLGTISSIPSITIAKDSLSNGTFTAGTILYFFTYCRKYGTETCIVGLSSLLYPSLIDRGGEEGELVSCAFKITINNVDTNYDFVRIYSNERSSLNGSSTSNLVTEIEIKLGTTSYTFVDNGSDRLAIPSSDIYTLGGLDVRATTIELKNNTLFLGNVKIVSGEITTALRNYINLKMNTATTKTVEGIQFKESPFITFERKGISEEKPVRIYLHDNLLNYSLEKIAGFKFREFYRFAISFLLKDGEWTSPLWIGDKYNSIKPLYDTLTVIPRRFKGYSIATAKFTPPSETNPVTGNRLWDEATSGYVAYRILVGEKNATNRRILALGVVNPTMFNLKDRLFNRPHAINSWMFRPRRSGIANRHYDTLPANTSEFAELLNISEKKAPVYSDSSKKDFPNCYMLYLLPDAGHRIKFKLILYNNENRINVISNIGEITRDSFLNENTNLCAKQHYSSIYTIIDGAFYKGTWKAAHDELLKLLNDKLELAGYDRFFTNSMIPSKDELKFMATVTAAKVNPNYLTACLVSGIIAAAALIVAACTWGLGAAMWPGMAAGAAACWSLILGSTMSIVSVAGTTSTTYFAEQLAKANAHETDIELARKGYFSIIPYSHELKYRKQYKEFCNSFINNYFDVTAAAPKIYVDVNNKTYSSFDLVTESVPLLDGNTSILNVYDVEDNPKQIWWLNNSIDNLCESNAYISTGLMTYETDFERTANDRQHTFYIDESIVTVNSPDIDSTRDIINNSEAIDFRLVGTIPIYKTYGDYSAYIKTLGVNADSKILEGRTIESFTSSNGFVNAAIFLDINPYLRWDEETSSWNKEITPTAASILYKVFLWNRSTSLSCQVPNIPIRNPFSTEENDYLNYVPAELLKKTFASMRYSNFSVYYDDFFDLDTENINIYDNSISQLSTLEVASKLKNYYGNVNTVSTVNSRNGYILVDGNNEPIWNNTDAEGNPLTNKLLLTDPISIKFSSLPHFVLSLKSLTGETRRNILPYINNEELLRLENLYPDIEGQYTIDGPSTFIQTALLEEETTLSSLRPNEQEAHLVSITGNPVPYDIWWLEFISWYSKYRTIPTREESAPASSGLTIKQKKAISLYVLKNLPKMEYNFIKVLKTEYSNGVAYTYKVFPKGVGFYYISLISYTPLTEITWKGNTYSLLEYNSVIVHDDGISNLTDLSSLILVFSAMADFCILFRNTTLGQCSLKYNPPLAATQSHVDWEQEDPYLFLGEFVNSSFSLPTSDFELKQINWNIGSPATKISLATSKTWGDTFYLRWDCQKTYPSTESDENGIVDILSFMVESYTNLDGRYDKNRGTVNIVNARPSNFNLINTAYSLSDNLFLQRILDSDIVSRDIFENLIVWSLTKSPAESTDKWLNINASNSINLNGGFGKISKIINFNDALIAFLDSGISLINYNELAALATLEGMPVILGNTGKVNGFVLVKDNIGCKNKWSITKTNGGIFFIDDLAKKAYMYSNDGIADIGLTTGMSKWFKDNITGQIWNANFDNTAFKTSYDKLTNDIYIKNNSTCLVYNEALQRFTSFMDYENTPIIIDVEGKSIAIHNNKVNNIDTISIHKLFAGDYNSFFGVKKPYWVTYRLNPSPYTDSIFTNFSYMADKLTDKVETTGSVNLHAHDTFTEVEAWNEYQYGKLNLSTTVNRHRHAKDRFRFWGGDIPRQGDTSVSGHGNRMRNPWIFLKLKNNDLSDNTKMVFHNLTVTYYK